MSAPSDLELMMYFDDELEEPRRADVAAWLATDQAGAAKLYGLEQVSTLLLQSDAANPTGRAADVANAVMAKITAGEVDRDEKSVSNGAAKKAAASVPDAVVRPIGSAKKAEVAPSETAANDNNGRFIFGLAAVAAVAAAAMFFWGRTTAPTVADNASPLPIVTAGASAANEAPTAIEPLGALPSATAEAEQESSGAEVAAVDFGSRSGSIYYVSGASQGATTAVVWLTDE